MDEILVAISIIGNHGTLWYVRQPAGQPILIPTHPIHDGILQAFPLDLNNPSCRQWIKDQGNHLPKFMNYHFECTVCHIANARKTPAPRLTCTFCGFTEQNDNYQNWIKLREILSKP